MTFQERVFSFFHALKTSF